MPHTVYKNQFKIDQIPKHKTKNYTPYRKKRENLCDSSSGNNFLQITKSIGHKEKHKPQRKDVITKSASHLITPQR